MNFFVENDKIVVDTGNIILINSNCAHSSETEPEKYTEICLLQFDPGHIYNSNLASEYKYLIPFINHDSFRYYLFNSANTGNYSCLANLLVEIAEEFVSKKIAYEILIKSNLYKILTVLYRDNILKFNFLNNLRKENELLSKLSVIFDYVEKNYAEQISVESASQMLGLNYFYFSRLFKAATGKSFIQYLNYVRISVSEKLLLTTNEAITDIIYETGFSSLSYFNKVFKQFKGCSHTDFRKRIVQK
jgi:AraC-like DNA-binding protein